MAKFLPKYFPEGVGPRTETFQCSDCAALFELEERFRPRFCPACGSPSGEPNVEELARAANLLGMDPTELLRVMRLCAIFVRLGGVYR